MRTNNAFDRRADNDGGPAMLDNPIWSALSTLQSHFALGDDLARCFPSQVTTLAGVRDETPECFDALYRSFPAGMRAALFLQGEHEFDAKWNVLRRLSLVQMIWTFEHSASSDARVVELGADDVEQMIALTSLTQPGPFGTRTRELGTYLGIHDAGRLVAMAGERLRFSGYTEVSAVCTHPDHRARGYSSALISTVVQRMIERGDTPFLHAAAENATAIRVYERLGFALRRTLNLAVLERPSDPHV